MMQTRMPDQFETHGSLQAFNQHYKLYGTDADYAGYHGTASVGDRIGKVAFIVSADAPTFIGMVGVEEYVK